MGTAKILNWCWNSSSISYLYTIRIFRFTIFCRLMFSKKNKKKGQSLSKKWFTLIEMLIVIVIIGILAAALIPRLSSARGRANDVARKADLAQTAAALVAYQIDHGSFPDCPTAWEWCTLDEIADDLISAGMDGIPTDPNTKRTMNAGIEWVSTTVEWQYAYIPIKKRGISNNGFVLMAATETAWWSNRVATANNDWIAPILDTTDFTEIILCKDILKTTSNNDNTNGDCEYVESADLLRYIYMY